MIRAAPNETNALPSATGGSTQTAEPHTTSWRFLSAARHQAMVWCRDERRSIRSTQHRFRRTQLLSSLVQQAMAARVDPAVRMLSVGPVGPTSGAGPVARRDEAPPSDPSEGIMSTVPPLTRGITTIALMRRCEGALTVDWVVQAHRLRGGVAPLRCRREARRQGFRGAASNYGVGMAGWGRQRRRQTSMRVGAGRSSRSDRSRSRSSSRLLTLSRRNTR